MRHALLLAMACTPPAQRDTLPQPEVRVDLDVSSSADGPQGRPLLAQPPEQKLVLGHHCDARYHIGLVIDRLGGGEARVRFDRSTERLAPRVSWHLHGGEKMLAVDDERGSILVSGREVWLARDGDAEPL